MIKNLSACILAILYLTAVNNNLIIFISFKINYDYILEFLCVQKDEPVNFCGGSCQLENRFETEDKKKEDRNSDNRSQNSFSLSFHLENHPSKNNIIPHHIDSFDAYFVNHFISYESEPSAPPPELL
ncbi:MAG: hypothetical protein NZM09_04240 [Ignavibacterium sp.]|nr:hypothetical protein [Ignavibacterium sp.]MDW8374887.1 hypothetical protein [Ignavibacteriales bacterium]